MNDTTFTGYILDQHRAADLARENELMVAHREHGRPAERPHGRTLAAWFRTATHHDPRTAAVRSGSGRRPSSLATR
jgi:hypothetical protein